MIRSDLENYMHQAVLSIIKFMQITAAANQFIFDVVGC